MCEEGDCFPLLRADGQLRPVQEVLGEVIDHALNHCASPTEAAVALGIGRSTVYRFIKEQSHG